MLSLRANVRVVATRLQYARLPAAVPALGLQALDISPRRGRRGRQRRHHHPVITVPSGAVVGDTLLAALAAGTSPLFRWRADPPDALEIMLSLVLRATRRSLKD